MKKVILFTTLFFLTLLHVFADVAIPFEEQCAKSIVTQESKQKFETCMQNCLKGDENNDWMCQKYSCGGPEICLYTNADKQMHTQKYLEAEGITFQKTDEKLQTSMLVKSIATIVICIAIFLGTLIYRKNKKHV